MSGSPKRAAEGRRPELLAPAGGPESLLAALRCGADAVYLGGKQLNARRGAENFDREALRRAAADCRLRGAKLYLTLNTLVFDSELPQLLEALEEACDAGVDAVIVQDLAVAAAVRRLAPGLALHASTQMSVHSLEGAKQLEALGFRRVVLAREMEQEEIRRVVEGTALEAECFVHGALCMCVSGQCALSSMIGGRSGNRGMCAQPCRLPFAAGGATHALSLRDLSLVEWIPRLRELGVASLKIEGRMKRPEYVAGAVAACRAALDGGSADLESLEAVFSRSGFTDGYFTGRRDGQLFGVRQKEDVTAASPQLLKKLRELYRREPQRVPVRFALRVSRGERTELLAADADGHSVTVRGEPPLEAVSAPTTPERARELLGKTGGTPYFVERADCSIAEGLLVPAAAVNDLRRRALEELSGLRTQRQVPFASGPGPASLPEHGRPERQVLRVRLHRQAQLTPGIEADGAEIALPLEELLRLSPQRLEPLRDRLLAELPRIVFGQEERLRDALERVGALGVTRALAGNLGGVRLAGELGFEVHGDFGLNVTNSVALEELQRLGLRDVTLSFELERERIQALRGSIPRGIPAYGRLPLMVMRACPVRVRAGCADCGGRFPALTDRLGNKFPVDCDGWGCSVLYNCVPLELADRLGEFDRVDFFTLYFTQETPEECGGILRRYRAGAAAEGEKTRGLYYRKVL